ncbi:hypothetical protein D3C81_2171690 [compost metagenome]
MLISGHSHITYSGRIVAKSIIPQKLNTYFAGFAQLNRRRKYSRVNIRVTNSSSQTNRCHSSSVR